MRRTQPRSLSLGNSPRRRVPKGRQTASVSQSAPKDSLAYRHCSTPVGKFSENGEEDGRCPEAANAPPACNVPAPGTQVRADGAADEVAEHVDHVEPAPGARVNAVNASLIGNVTALHPKIHQDDADDQTDEVLARKTQKEKGEQG